ncbi:unnamed protein product [Vitrella brassicaformis CCMP3155]|uniref:Uncharacterized protein n=1 Tax=Vitrella brassicaformis (strain CCMP3155) TaxID=1169540 RepID=A0A0G4EV80_VITBC|nr:unnamed protein product [Vitrella brassicaformis CCMP3155]|eukprot:CEM01969.1 unnamed protein product [Vitrella brassicaformis CCMP3155]
MSRRLQQSQSAQLIGRSRAERLLDRLYHHQSKELRKRQREQGAAAGVNEALKRQRLAIPAPAAPVKKPRSEPVAQTPVDALAKIVTYAQHRQKFPKAMELLIKLTKDHMTAETKGYFLTGIGRIMAHNHATSSPEGRPRVIQLFEQELLPKTKSGDGGGEPFFGELEREFVEILAIAAVHHNKLFTDDTYQFTTSLSRLKAVFEALEPYTQTEIEEMVDDDEQEQQEAEQKVEGRAEGEGAEGEPAPQEHRSAPVTVKKEQDEEPSSAGDGPVDAAASSAAVKPEEQDNDSEFGSSFAAAAPSSHALLEWSAPSRDELCMMKRLYFFNALSTIFTYRHKSWARTAVEHLFQQVYLKRSLFSPAEQEQISSWQSDIKTHKKQGPSVGALGIGEAADPVRDAREERLSTAHGSGVWAAKQFGL